MLAADSNHSKVYRLVRCRCKSRVGTCPHLAGVGVGASLPLRQDCSMSSSADRISLGKHRRVMKSPAAAECLRIY
jgi:hypothetical protein